MRVASSRPASIASLQACSDHALLTNARPDVRTCSCVGAFALCYQTGANLFSILPRTSVLGMQTISIVFFTDTWRPESFYDKLVANKSLGLHTLCLLDIKVKEPTLESLARGKPVYEPPRYMTVNTCIEQLLEIEGNRGEGAATGTTMAVGVARMGADDQVMRAGTMDELLQVDFGPPLHSFVVCGDLDSFEEEMLELIR